MTLKELIHTVGDVFHIYICVHDVSGITYTNRALAIDYSDKSHSCAYCSRVKEVTGKHACMQQKLIVMRYLRIMQQQGLYGVCRMGMCEFVLPVVKAGHLLAVVFVSAAVQADYNLARTHVLRSLRQEELDESHPFMAVFEQFYRESSASRESLAFFAHLVADMLLAHSSSMTVRYIRADSAHLWKAITPTHEFSSSWILQSVIPYIQENFRSPLSLQHFANLFFTSPQYLCRVFSNEMGTGLMAYVNYLRIHDAAREIATTARPIADIGADVGISDANYFYRLFKKKMGMTPTEYRRMYHDKAVGDQPLPRIGTSAPDSERKDHP